MVDVFTNGSRTLRLHLLVVWLLATLPLRLWRRPVQAVIRDLTPRQVPASRAPWTEVPRAQRAVERLFHRRGLNAYGPCLRRSLTLYYLLTRLGYPVRVALGATTHQGSLVAHAWLVLDGAPLLESDPVDRYAVMAIWGHAPAPTNPRPVAA